jgi:hypothetical protein
MSALIKYDQARQALAACRSVDEIKDIRDKSEAMRLYAKQAQDTELEQWAAEIKFRAQRALGELSATLPTQKGGFGIVPTGGKHKAEVLAEAGISTSTANRYEKLASIPEPVIEEIIAKSKEDGKPVSAKAVLAKAAPPTPRAQPRAPTGAATSPTSIATSRDDMSAPGPVEIISPGVKDDATIDDEHDDFVDRLVEENKALAADNKDLIDEVARLKERIKLLTQDDLAAQIDTLSEKCARFDSLASTRYSTISDLEKTIKVQRGFIDGLRRSAGLPKGGDLDAWIKQAAQRAA